MTLQRPIDVVVVGDGPAGSALALACRRRDLDVLLVGPGQRWEPTFGAWIDDLDGVEAFRSTDGADHAATVFSSTLPSMAVYTVRAQQVVRPYGVFDNEALEDRLRNGIEHHIAMATDLRSAGSGRHVVELSDGTALSARLIVDTTGWPSSFARRAPGPAPAWQTAMGVVLDRPPPGDLGEPTWMDFRPVSAGGTGVRSSTIGPAGVSTFCYALPVRDGWLVEETVLAARPAVEPIALLARLAARLGRHPDDLLADAVRTEYVRIPMGGARPIPDQPVVAFGAAAGYVHPATGFSISASLRAAGRVADAIAMALSSGPPDTAVVCAPIAEAVWPSALRRTRQLHEHGLRAILRFDDQGVREFFGTFFDLPVDRWREYLHIDAAPGEVASVMAELFRASSWSMRRQLMAGNPLPLARLLRP